jgi:hypothetical protein
MRFALNGKWGARDWPDDFPAAGAMFSYSRVTANGKGESLWSSGPINEPLDIMVSSHDIALIFAEFCPNYYVLYATCYNNKLKKLPNLQALHKTRHYHLSQYDLYFIDITYCLMIDSTAYGEAV